MADYPPQRKCTLDDLDQPVYKHKKDKDMKICQADRFLEAYFQDPYSDIINEFRRLHQMESKPTKETLFPSTESIFRLLGFTCKYKDQTKLIYSKALNNQELYITFIVDPKNEQISLTSHLNFSGNKNIDLNNSIHKDILSHFTNEVNANLLIYSMDYGQKNRAIQCQTSTIGQLDENYLNWLFINIDAVTIGVIEANNAFEFMYKNGEGPHESKSVSEKQTNIIKDKLVKNKETYNQFLSNIFTPTNEV